MSEPNHRDRLKQIAALYKSGQKSQARLLIGEMAKANPNDADVWYVAGQILEETPRKIKAFERALSINPSHQAARTALDNLRDAHDLLNSVFSDTDGLLDDLDAPSPSYAAKPPATSGKLNYSDPKILGGIIATTLVFGIFLGALCLGTVNSGRFLGIVFAPTSTPSKTPTATPTFTPTRTPTPTQDIAATATSLASTQQYFDATSTALALVTAQAVLETQVAQQFSQTATAVAVVNQQIEAAIAGTQLAISQFAPTWTPSAGDSVTQTALPIDSAYTNLAFSPLDADYSPSLDRIIFVSESPNQLHIYNPGDTTDTIVELSRVPRAVSVGPDGLFAAVGHDAKISYVDLKNARVLTTLDITADVGEIALGGNGWIYVVPGRDQWESVRAINIASNTEVGGGMIYAGAEIRMHPDGNRLYTATRGLSPGDIARYDFVDSVPLQGQDSRYHGDYPTCGDMWFSADGSRIFTPCGTVFRSAIDVEQDMIYNGTLEGISGIAHLVHVPTLGRIVGISGNDSALAIWDYETYTTVSMSELPQMVINGRLHPVFGSYVFVNPAATRYYAIVRAGDNDGIVFGLLVADLPR